MSYFIDGTKRWFNTVMQPFGLMKKNFGNLIAFEVNFRLFTFFGMTGMPSVCGVSPQGA